MKRPSNQLELVNLVMGLYAEIEQLKIEQAKDQRQCLTYHYGSKERDKRLRGRLIRLESGSSGNRWHTGGAYELGSRLIIPEKPLMLADLQELVEKRKSRYRGDTLAEELKNDGSTGLPRSI